ncbi:MAG: PPC domain-containing DNA-binding protein [Fidelibacterota bacterium]
MKYQIDGKQVFITLARGDFIIESLEAVAIQENISSGCIQGIGAIDFCELGFYDFGSKIYKKEEFNGEFELTNLTGNITIKEESPFIHAHVTISDEQFAAKGGHLFEGRISAAGEFIMNPGTKKIVRQLNEEIGLAVWNFGGENA